jgi:hypothetical protein
MLNSSKICRKLFYPPKFIGSNHSIQRPTTGNQQKFIGKKPTNIHSSNRPKLTPRYSDHVVTVVMVALMSAAHEANSDGPI